MEQLFDWVKIYNMTEENRQLVKEEAIKKGIERGMALMREDLKMYGMRSNGIKTFICESKDYDSLWEDALKNIELIQSEEAADKAEEYLNNWKRERADFVNYKKDEARRVGELLKFSTEGIITELIDVIDGIEVSRRNFPDDKEMKDWLDGFDSSLDKLDKFLEKFGVNKIETKGEKFDPLIHEAVEIQDKDGENIEEIRPGYTMHGKVIRPARVKIIK